jgi:hypothetical protein
MLHSARVSYARRYYLVLARLGNALLGDVKAQTAPLLG